MARINPDSDKFLEGVEMGMAPIQAAGWAGYSNPSKSSRDLLARPEIKAQYDIIKARIRDEARVTRSDVEKGILEAVEMARIMSDPLGMIRGYAEINKMQGNYAPEKRQLEITGKQKRLTTQLEELSEQELMELVANAGEELTIIDGDFYEVVEEDEEGVEPLGLEKANA